ncbi:MAG TPA: glycerol-3-phosphate dehydrogenase/oxidase [Vicinamibacterales bacterium]|nr:glycerol-3-phosphate dehydrogenase/oxidase [Vicinamibacterales bacterium]
MHRDLDRLTAGTFDVLVVGGGIYGLAIAYDAAQRGLSVALVERDDFGSGASFNHLRTIHGGLRYLQSLDVRRSRESMRERRTIARIAPHLVQPLPFAVPLYRSLTRGKLAMRAGFALDRVIAWDRNSGVPAPLCLPAGRVVSRASAIERFPGLRRQGLTGAAVFYDYVTTESDRLTFSFALAAVEHGALLANHVEAVEPIVDSARRVSGVRARDRIGSGTLEVRSKLVVNAAGSVVDALLKPLGLSSGVPMMKAMNLFTRREAGDEALGGRAKSGRNLFLVPWRRRALFGTWESSRVCDPADTSVDAGDITAFIGELNDTFPALDLTPADVTLVHRGIVPASVEGGRVALEGHEQVRDHAAQGVEGLLTVAGAKFTTARAAAERVTDLILSKLQHAPVPCRTAATALPGGALRDLTLAVAEARREHDAGLPSDTIPHLVAAYGSRYRDVLDVASERADWRSRIAADSPVIGAELIRAVRKEMAMTLADAVVRRTPLAALGCPGEDALARAAAIVGAELRWTADRQMQEVGAVKAVCRGPAMAP